MTSHSVLECSIMLWCALYRQRRPKKKKLKPYLFIGANKTGAVKTDRCRDFLTLKSSQPGQLDEDLIRLKSSAPIKGAKISMLDTLHNTGGNQNLKITCPR